MWKELAEHADRHGVERIALELHPLHLVYNVPTLLRLRDTVGPVIGANVDPSHMFWHQMDPVACIEALGDAAYHAHLKDSEVVASQVAPAGVLDNRPFADPKQRAWVFRGVRLARSGGVGEPARTHRARANGGRHAHPRCCTSFSSAASRATSGSGTRSCARSTTGFPRPSAQPTGERRS
jgi:hypothetical protein